MEHEKPTRKPRRRLNTAAELRAVLRRETRAALAALVEIAQHGSSESARIAAANALLDRGWGRPKTGPHEQETPEYVTFTIQPPPGYREPVYPEPPRGEQAGE